MSRNYIRRIFEIQGIVQGVGFRPFLYRIAKEHALGGWARNGIRGVTLCVEGTDSAVEDFTRAIIYYPPPLARIDRYRYSDQLIHVATRDFLIQPSDNMGENHAVVPPDAYVCEGCLRELFDPADRRYRYPLINCTDCGPRFSIICAMPYDRPLTTMATFQMCPTCQREYDSVSDRRFHAQPNACPQCGPQVQLTSTSGQVIDAVDPIAATAELLSAGKIVAVKAHGGFQLMVDAQNHGAVELLRSRKERGGKPFALLARDVAAAAEFADISAGERDALTAVTRPIVILRRKESGRPLPEQVSPGVSTVGIMLPSTPLQHLLLASGFPLLVATSGNAAGEPMSIDEESALNDLSGICDAFLVHNRRINARIDDSIVRVISAPAGPKVQLIRRARGYVPVPIRSPVTLPPVLAVGAELKNTVSMTRGDQVLVSQHIGDLKSIGNREFFDESLRHFKGLFDVSPNAVAHDLHPAFWSTRYAAHLGIRTIPVQHHHAHMASCMLDNGLNQPVIGVILDGTGLGPDGTIWGGEFLIGDYYGYERAGHLERFRLPGGDKAVFEPDRIALALLYKAFGTDAREIAAWLFPERDPEECELILRMCSRGVNSPITSSAGRLFDGISALLGVCRKVGYEAEAAIRLEDALPAENSVNEIWPTKIERSGPAYQIRTDDWIRELVSQRSEQVSVLSHRFHESMSLAIAEMCLRLRHDTGINFVVLSGGVFLNRYLSARVSELLMGAGFEVFSHSDIPMNDGGISAGQAMIAGVALMAEHTV